MFFIFCSIERQIEQFLSWRICVCDCNATAVGSIHTREGELLFMNIYISSFWHQGKSMALNSDTQQAMKNEVF